MSERVKITPISGFPEHLPNERLAEQRFISLIQRQYELFGFSPIETPAVERWEVLTAKGGMERQTYKIGNPKEDDAGYDLGLHFDLTVPLARYVVQHNHELVFPFRRYQIQKVWRGEKAQRGRYREFYQCDIDIIGRENLDMIHDAEIPVVINSTFEALGIPEFTIFISNRKIWDELLKIFNITGVLVATVLAAIDKTLRDGVEATKEALKNAKISDEAIVPIISLLQAKTLEDARKLLVANNANTIGIDELAAVIPHAEKLGMPSKRIRPNFSIARGLDIYSGIMYETFITGKEEWGSVCSGGRFDHLASYFSTQKFPGVGISIGLSRLFRLLVEADYVDISAHTPTKVLVTMQDRKFLNDYLSIAKRLRESGIPTEIYLDESRLGDQLSYASAKGIPFALIAGEREFNMDLHNGDTVVQMKDLKHKVQEEVSELDVPDYIRRKLNMDKKI